MKIRYDTYCGLYCGACAVLIANENDEVQKKAKEWDVKPEEIKCFGCKSNVTAIYCKSCEMRQCAKKKQVEYCYECDDYPCSRFKEFRDDKYPHRSTVLKNLESIRNRGLAQWLAEQKMRWCCPKCKTRFSWYDKVCKNCGDKLYNCEQEEKDISK